MPGISLRTVYQTLTDLTRMGELQSFDFGASSTQFDPNVDEHHHLVCAACGAVVDVYVSGVDQLATTPALPDAEFSVFSTDIVFRGHCKNCRDDLTATSHTATSHTATRSQP